MSVLKRDNLFHRAGRFLRSIRFRLAAWFVLILALVVASFSGFVYVRQYRELQTMAVARLEYKAQRLRGFLRLAGRDPFNHGLSIPTDPATGVSLFQEGDVLAFADPDGQVTQALGPLDPAGATTLVQATLHRQGEDNSLSPDLFSADLTQNGARSQYALVLAPVSSEGSLVGYIMIGNAVDPSGILPRLRFSLILGSLLMLLVALLGGVWMADRAMRPVKTITQAAHAIGETDLSMRLHFDRKDELGELANTFDEMLARLEAAFARQRQFTADASHELRTPLTIVGLEASRALEAPRSSQEYQRALAVIQSENGLMSRMVSNLLTLARMDAGQVTLQKEELDLSDIALDVLERLAPLANKTQVRLWAGDLPELPILGDRQYLVQMFTNLVENAIKYSSGEGKRVEVITGSRSEAGRTVAWARVIDNGPGISAEHLPRLFDRFYQVDKARTRGDQDESTSRENAGSTQFPSGTGLGLSIARWIARAHGGDIRVESEVGKGSIFEVTIPQAALLPIEPPITSNGREMHNQLQVQK